MVEDFDSKYEKIHREIQANAKLVRSMYSISREKGLIVNIKDDDKRYFPCGFIRDIFLGLDLDDHHNFFEFPKILAKMRILYQVSDGQAELLRVYAQLDDKLGIVSEDVSHGGKSEIKDSTGPQLIEDCVKEVFSGRGMGGLCKTTFSVKEDGCIVRLPIVDLDHVDVHKKYNKIFKKYCKQYESDERFRIHEV